MTEFLHQPIDPMWVLFGTPIVLVAVAWIQVRLYKRKMKRYKEERDAAAR